MGNWEENVRKVVPYVPGEQPNKPGMIKLNTNENPYPPSPAVMKALREIRADGLRRYPDPSSKILIDAIAESYGIDPNQVFVGVGSDDVLAMTFMTFFNSNRPVLFPDITYSFYDVWADLLRIPYEIQALDEQFCICKEDYKKKNGGVIFPNPNAPTGVLLELGDIEEIIQANRDVVVVIDEAYIDFGGESALPLIEKYDNLLVVQTFSKSRALAGMRIGCAFGQPMLIKYLNDVKYSFNSYTMDETALAIGAAAVRDKAYYKETVKKIVSTREWVKKELREMGFVFEDSMSNFIFAAHTSVRAQYILEELRKNNIYVRHFHKPIRISNYLRITIGTDDEMKKFLKTLKNILEKR